MRNLNIGGVTALLLASTLSVRADVAALDAIQQAVSGLYSAVSSYGIAVDADAAKRVALDSVLKSIDAKGRLLSADEWKHIEEERRGLDYTPGFQLNISNGLPYIIHVMPESPAAAAGIRTNDVIIDVAGTSVSPAPLVHMLKSLRSHTNDSVRLVLQRTPATTNAVTVQRDLLQLPALEVAEIMPAKIGYALVNGLFEGSGALIEAQIEGASKAGCYGMVIDLRGANGNSVTDAARVAGLFADSEATLCTFRDLNGAEKRVERNGKRNPVAMPVMILIDHDTSGAAEVLAAMMAGSVRGAMLIGQTTEGDPMIREAVALPGGELAYLTVQKLVTADGQVFDGKTGVHPDVIVKTSNVVEQEFEPDMTSDRREALEQEIIDKGMRERMRGDAVLRRAVDILLGLKALNIRGFSAATPDSAD